MTLALNSPFLEAQTGSPTTDLESGKRATVLDLLTRSRKGETAAQFSLATAYDSGYGVPQDHSRALYWYRKAAESGHHYAQFNLGNLYEEGLGTDRNLSLAGNWYRKAALGGVKEAQSNLGRLLAGGEITGQPDYSGALHWFKRAADAGHTEAQYNLALMYLYGLGVEESISRAKELLAPISDQYPQARETLETLP